MLTSGPCALTSDICADISTCQYVSARVQSAHLVCRVRAYSQAERNNGRAAMMGITGMVIHNALGVDSLFPIVQ